MLVFVIIVSDLLVIINFVFLRVELASLRTLLYIIPVGGIKKPPEN